MVGYPSKSAALVLSDAGARGGVEPVLILRSDSNVEDLAGRAHCRFYFGQSWAAQCQLLCALPYQLSCPSPVCTCGMCARGQQCLLCPVVA